MKVRPLTNSGMAKLRAWMEREDWDQVLKTEDVDVKAERLQSMVLSKLNEFCPEKYQLMTNQADLFL